VSGKHKQQRRRTTTGKKKKDESGPARKHGGRREDKCGRRNAGKNGREIQNQTRSNKKKTFRKYLSSASHGRFFLVK